MYSQNNEEEIILRYFGDKIGTFLDIGANDGKTLSNTYQLALNGWSGSCIEPSKIAFNKMQDLYGLANENIELFNYALSDRSGIFEFYESGEHLGKGDTSLLSTLVESELQRWRGTKDRFTKTIVDAKTFREFLIDTKFAKFNVISIDIEGKDYDVLTQIDLSKIGCEMLIVETNGKENDKYINYISNFGLKLIHQNFENLIFARP
jgi:FkbM family methyltransferase